MERQSREQHLARLVVDCERLGILNGWRAYLMAEFKKLGHDNAQIKRLIEEERVKQ